MQDQVKVAMEAVRRSSPLVHNITNFVVMEVTANALLASGASPLMAHAPEELDDLLSIASALVLNIGTLDAGWISSMEKAGELARRHGVPVVLDPVGAGASRLRTETALRLLKSASPAVVRGNGSEIMALAPHPDDGAAATRGVDSTRGSHEAERAALDIARRYHCVVSVSGEEDMITDGNAIVLVRGGSPLMTRVTGLGCSATAVTAAHVAVASSPLVGAAAGMAVMASAGEAAAKKAQGPGTFLPLFLDALSHIDAAEASSRVRTL